MTETWAKLTQSTKHKGTKFGTGILVSCPINNVASSSSFVPLCLCVRPISSRWKERFGGA